MASTSQNLETYAGDTVVIEFTIRDPAGAPIDATGAEFLYTLKARPSDVVKLNADMDLDDIATGKVLVTLSAGETDVIPAGAYKHALQMTLDGITQHVSVGRVKMLAEIAN